MNAGLVILGAGLAVIGGLAGKFMTDRIDALSLRIALRAEILAVLGMLNSEKFVSGLNEEINWLKREPTSRDFNVTFRNAYNVIFSGSVSKLGLLPRSRIHDYWQSDDDLLADVVTFYYSLQAVIELSEMISAAKPTRADDVESLIGLLSLSAPHARLDAFNRLLKMTLEMQERGEDLANRLA